MGDRACLAGSQCPRKIYSFDPARMIPTHDILAAAANMQTFMGMPKNQSRMNRLSFPRRSAKVLLVIGLVLVTVPGSCLEQKKSGMAAESATSTNEVRQFCANNIAIAGDARIAWQTSKLLDLEARIKERLVELETRKAELVEWLRKHDEAMKKAADEVVAIYLHMKPDAAASQIAAMDDATATAVIAKLPPRVAGTIFNEMEPARAVQLTHGMLAPENAQQRKKS